MFKELHIAGDYWLAWMEHKPEHVIACLLHARDASGVRSPQALARSMLEAGAGAPDPKYVQAAQRLLSGETDEEREQAARYRYITGEMAELIDH